MLTRHFLQSQLNEWRLAHKRWSAEKLRLEAERHELELRLADVAELANHTAESNEDINAGMPKVDGGFLSALDYALRGSPGCIEPADWQQARQAALAEHGPYLGLKP